MRQAGNQDNENIKKTMATSELPELNRLVEELRIAHRQLWMTTYKAVGWEVLDIRYGGVLARIRSAEARLIDFAEGRGVEAGGIGGGAAGLYDVRYSSFAA
ncbi:hypothetical protein GZH47_26035 [Paenibacillus rhizovicinus]|uniref:Glycoside Hydrolase 20C C-terminal domain-containing protein n=1 Tax=Paenibacillus rhizovicinus TaxID=2704463 RepID=A0A6C0P643_9BACL|nr:hypothetical protein GZH47_26035 [Paenibacillus rhizovicinus]